MKKKWLILSSLSFVFPSFLFSCTKNDFNQDKFHYIEKNNFANDYKNFAYLEDNFSSKNIHEINLATSAKLLRIKAAKQPEIDFRDNIVLFPSELAYQFEWAKQIIVDAKKFDNDQTDVVDYSNESEEKSGVFKPKRDKGNGFNSPFLFIPSSNNNSINSPKFKDSLNLAKKLIIQTSNANDAWIDNKGKKIINNNQINAKAFKLGLLAKMLRNKDFRQKYGQSKNFSFEKYAKQNAAIDGFDLNQYLQENHIDIETLLDFDSSNAANEIVLKTKNDQAINFLPIFENLFIIQNYFDAIPYEMLKNKYGSLEDNLNWFFEYGKTYQDRFYAANYYINQMNNNQTRLKKNPDYKNNTSNNLNEITIQYNLLSIAQTTFSLQATNAFKQNIISKIEYENLNINEKDYLLKNYKKYNFSYQRNYNRFVLNNKIIINHNPLVNTPYMNQNFLKLFYGLNEKTNQFELKKENLIFQSLFNNIINQYSLVDGNNDVWLSQAPENLLLDANNQSLNTTELKDAFLQISKPIIFSYTKNKKIENTFQYQNKNQITNPQIIKLEEKIKSFWFEEIKTNLQNMIDKFYANNQQIEQEIFLNLPILINLENQFTDEKISLIKKILNSIHQKFRVEITQINDYEKYIEFFSANKSIYKDTNFFLFEGVTSEYLFKQITNKDLNLEKLITFLAKNSDTYHNVYTELINLNKFISTNNFRFSNKEIRNYLKNLKTENQLNMINEINNLISYSINFKNQINIDNFAKVVFQKHLIKPIGWNNLNYFQDIEVWKANNEKK